MVVISTILERNLIQVTGYQDDNALLGVDSTILDLSVSPARILRQGKITKDDLLAALPELTME